MFLFKLSSSETSTNIASLHGVTSQKTVHLIKRPLRWICRYILCVKAVFFSLNSSWISQDTLNHAKLVLICMYIHIYTGCPRRNVPDFGRVFLMLKYTDITQNTYVLPQRWIGRAAEWDRYFVKWPPRSPDITPCDFFYGDTLNMWCMDCLFHEI
jgi:hypothetical protein